MSNTRTVSPPLGTTKELLMLAWPVVGSYLLNNFYRINDQFWIRDLGRDAQAAIGMTFFVQVLNFALFFLAVGGTMSAVARSIGAGDLERRDSMTRHGLGLGIGLGLLLIVLELPLLSMMVGALGLEAGAASSARDYLLVILAFSPAIGLFVTLDATYLGRGQTRVPMVLQFAAVCLNYCLNPILIFGAEAKHVDAPGAALFGTIAEALGIEGRGIAGAALATGISRSLVATVGLLLLRFRFGVDVFRFGRPVVRRLRAIVSVGAPVSFSIAVYGFVYLLLQALVLSKLGTAVTAGLGIGFQVFEGVAFPCYLGFAVAGSSLVGRAVGALDADAAWRVVRRTRASGRVLGLVCSAGFLAGGRWLIPLFTDDPGVAAETWSYVSILAVSQYWVAVEAINEKALMGSGYSKPILWIAPVGNFLRVPLAAGLALGLGLGAVGVWWTINLTTMWKAWLYWRMVERGRWLELAFKRERAEQVELGPDLPSA